MNSITLGPFILTIPVLIWAGSVLAGLAVHRLRFKGRPEAPILGSVLTGAVLIWLICWKLSAIVFDPSAFRTLLYFHGGTRGAWLAAAVATAYVVYAARKHAVHRETAVESILVFLLGGYSAKLLLQFILGEGNRPTLGLLAILGAVFLFRWLYRKAPSGGFSSVQIVILFAIGHAVISTLGHNLWEKTEVSAAASTIGLEIGQQAPDFELTDTNGRRVRLSDLRDKTVVLNFWATWCPPCRAEMPELQKFYDTYRDRGVAVVAVNATNTEKSSDAVGRWLQNKGFTLPVVYDAGGDAAQTYRVYAFPATFIIGQGGIIREKHQGPMNGAMLSDAVN